MKTFTPTPRADRLAAYCITALVFLCLCCIPVSAQAIDQSSTYDVLVTKVVDGDTFYCVAAFSAGETDTVKVRVLNLDTFEKARGERLNLQAERMNITPERALFIGKLAKEYATDLMRGKIVTIHRGTGKERNHDKYGRLLRYVTLPDGRDLSEVMKEQGFNVKR